MTLKGTQFESREDMQNATNQLNTISKTEFQDCFQKRQKRWGKCVHHMETTLKRIKVSDFQINQFATKGSILFEHPSYSIN